MVACFEGPPSRPLRKPARIANSSALAAATLFGAPLCADKYTLNTGVLGWWKITTRLATFPLQNNHYSTRSTDKTSLSTCCASLSSLLRFSLSCRPSSLLVRRLLNPSLCKPHDLIVQHLLGPNPDPDLGSIVDSLTSVAGAAATSIVGDVESVFSDVTCASQFGFP